MASSPIELLPQEVVQIIFDHLEPRDLCHFCMTSKSIHQEYQYDSYYWRNEVVRTFRLPVSPLLSADGGRWYWLYKKLKTQTRVYTWGQGLRGGLGRAHGARLPRRPVRPSMTYERISSPWPTEAHIPVEIGIVADLQCGGFSTSVLTSDGNLYAVGIIDAADGRHVGPQTDNFTRLEHLSQSTTGIRSFSAGRRHVLALDDNNEILSWDRFNAPGYKVRTRTSQYGGVGAKTVAAGWTHSSAYIPDTGIIYWSPVVNNHPDKMLDAVDIREVVISGTSRRLVDSFGKSRYNEVLKHIVLEGYIVWISGVATTSGTSKIFAAPISTGHDASEAEDAVFEIPGYDGYDLVDIQGSFRSYMVFTATGEVLAGNTDYLNRCYEHAHILSPSVTTDRDLSQNELIASLVASRSPDVPALQHRGVIGLAFGDYHYLALHSNGKLTAYGRDPCGLGALGLGQGNVEGMLRGLVKSGGASLDYELLPIAYRQGREVWFEPEKRKWLLWILAGLTPEQRQEILETRDKHTTLSEWVEREGQKWEHGPSSDAHHLSSDLTDRGTSDRKQSSSHDYNNLGAYFAISVAAAGWHSGALVLVNDEKAEAIRQQWLVEQPHADEQEGRMPGHFDTTPAEQEEYIWEQQRFQLNAVSL